MQFDRLVQGPDAPRTLILQTDAAQLTLTRHGNVVSCVCELSDPSDEGYEALRRRGAVDDTFMISPKLQPREFGIWLERLLTEDLGADSGGHVTVVELETALIV